MSTICGGVSLGFTEETFPSGIHACYIFSDSRERESVIARFLARGLEDGESVSAFLDTFERGALLRALAGLGLPSDDPTYAGRLALTSALETYCPDGRFDPDAMLERLRALGQIDPECYAGMRATGEMTWALNGLPGSERLMEYEARLNDVVQEQPCVNALCQYDANRFSPRTLAHVLRVHPLMVVRGQLIRNPHYESRAGTARYPDE